MGKFYKGILGGFSGTIGTVIGGSWKGIDYMRSKPSKGSRTPSQAQIEHRAKFAICMKFLRPISSLLEITFKGLAVQMNGINSAFSYALENAVKGTYPDFSIDYSRVLLSRGDLANVGNPTDASAANSSVKFNWTENSGIAQAKGSDKMIIVLYCPDLRTFIYTIGTSNPKRRFRKHRRTIIRGPRSANIHQRYFRKGQGSC